MATCNRCPGMVKAVVGYSLAGNVEYFCNQCAVPELQRMLIANFVTRPLLTMVSKDIQKGLLFEIKVKYIITNDSAFHVED